jgi:hypothetical protein
MTQLQFQTRQARARRRWRSSLFLFCTIGINFTLVPQAKSDFIGNYALNNWTLTNTIAQDPGCSLTNTSADGFATTPDGGVTVIITGPNIGNGLCSGTTGLTIAAGEAGQVQFDWSYSSLDAPSFDNAGYLTGNTFLQLADSDGHSGTVMFPIASNEIFGFRVGTVDNQGEPGILTVTNFNVSPDIASVPEPGAAPMLLVAIVLIGAQKRRRHFNFDRLRRT